MSSFSPTPRPEGARDWGAAVLQMPSSYVPMSTEEMEYLEGGAYYSARKTLGDARKFFSNLMRINTVGAIASAIGACFCAALALGTAYSGYVVGKATKCYNWVEKQRSKYSNSTKCTVGATTYGIFVTDLDVGW